MKVLFAVSNEEISESIVKKYQKEYKEIISSKNVYYFKAILKELQKDKTYDRVVISEDLEAFPNTQYDQIDKFIFEKLDSISDEASNIRGNDIPIILICSDRRTKSEQLLIKLFGIGIYDAIIGNDRSIEQVCKLINKPRLKKEAKVYYKIDSEEVNYQAENENDVSEMEIQNIVAHYKRLGKNEEKYVESFDNIAAQYNDTQLRIITKFLPLNVRAVLEEKSPKYQQVMSFNNSISDNLRYKATKEENKGPTETLLKQVAKETQMTEPIVIPSSVNIQGSKKLSRNTTINNQTEANEYQDGTNNMQNNSMQMQQDDSNEQTKVNPYERNTIDEIKEQLEQYTNNTIPETEFIQDTENIEEEVAEPVKRGRGRPRKNPVQIETKIGQVKRGRGRPRKNPIQETQNQQENANNISSGFEEENNNMLPGFDDIDSNNMLPGFDDIDSNNILPGFDDIDNNNMLPGFDDVENNNMMPGFEDVENNNMMPEFEDIEDNNMLPGFEEENNNMMPGFEDADNNMMPGFEDVNNNMLPGFEEENNNMLPGFEQTTNNNTKSEFNTKQDTLYNQNSKWNEKNLAQASEDNEINNQYSNNYNNTNNQNNNANIEQATQYQSKKDLSYLLTPDKKIATFVGTSKNGTSFIVNNIAEYMSSVMGVKTAILDTTKNRNSYYIYTKNEDKLRDIAAKSIEGLARGTAQGIEVNKNLSVFTSLPNEENLINYTDEILETLVKNYSLVLIDTDFDTPLGYFKQTQDLYLVQTLDILTIQPLTAFLRDLKAKNILDEQKLRIILNKTVKMRGITDKTIIGGMAYYNDPCMSFMTELFDRNTIKYLTVPFQEEIYTKYLQGIIECEISLKGYPKSFNQTLGQLANMIYPMGKRKSNNSYIPPQMENNGGNGFSQNMNQTLEQMRKNF